MEASPRPRIAEMLDGLSSEQVSALMAGLPARYAIAISESWDLWQLPYQRMPDGVWRWWIAQMGRGAGKTYMGARTTNAVASDRKKIRTGEIAIVGRTHAHAHRLAELVVETAPHDFKPEWNAQRGLLTWPNAVKGWALSGDAPETILGGNHAFVWGDEIAAWPDPDVAWWEYVEPSIRVGWARALITSTPKPTQFFRDFVRRPGAVVTRATTYDNPFLDPGARNSFLKTYEGTRRGQEQLLGEILDDLTGALWLQSTIDEFRVDHLPVLSRVIVSVDPAGGKDLENDETGIVVCGLDAAGHGHILFDDSGRWGATEWPARAVALFRHFKADKIIGEINFGGDLVEAAVRAVDRNVPFSSVRATRGKVLRAEPVAALYEQGRVHHVGHLPALERQLTEWIPGPKSKSPDRLDAAVHGITDLMLSEETPGGSIYAYLD